MSLSHKITAGNLSKSRQSKETIMLINPADLKNRLLTLSQRLMQLRGRL